MVKYGYGPCETCAKALHCQMRTQFNINGCLDHAEEIVVNMISNTTNPPVPTPTKELNPLEIVKRWKAQIHWNKDWGWDKEIATVEKELTDAEKYKKALEILKKKKVNVWTLLDTKTVAAYNFREVVVKPKRKLTEKEYDFLKEMFKCIKN